MIQFTLNHQPISIELDQKLLPWLRDEQGLTSVKNGCEQGVCGTCMVLVDGQAKTACTQNLFQLEGKHIITLEGLPAAERDVFAHAFARAGAVQCGFCLPGMIISAKALIDQNRNPSRDDVRKAIRRNICRCTGYQKIIDGIILAAAMLRGDILAEQECSSIKLGENALRVDALKKAGGSGQFVDDVRLPLMLHGVALRAAHPRAKLLSVDISAAKDYLGVHKVLLAADIPGQVKIGHLRPDYPVLIGIGEITNFRGDAIALVAAETRDTARIAADLIIAKYEVLSPILSPKEAAKQDAPHIHEGGNLLSRESLQRGDVEKALAESAFQVTNTYELPFTEHAFLEPECALAYPEAEGIVIYSGDQGIYQTQKEVAAMLGFSADKVRVRASFVGGGFGGKEDMSVQHHAALLAYHCGCPVKVRLSRDESMQVHPKRHAMTITMTTAIDAAGNITAIRARLLSDTGAYSSLGGPVLQRACTHASGPYKYHNIDIIGEAYYTNNPPGGAFRGFGVTQSCTALECNLNQLAKMAGIDPWQLRWINAAGPGDLLPNGQIAREDTAFKECLLAVKPFYDAHPGAGIAAAMKNSGLGVGVPDVGRCCIRVKEGKAYIYCSAACIGQGCGTVLLQMVSHSAGLDLSQVEYCQPDTENSPNCGNTTASRQTVFAGEASRLAAIQLKTALDTVNGDLAALEGLEFLGEYECVTDSLNTDKESPFFHVAYSFAAHCVALDDEGRVQTIVAAHDVGQPINPQSVEGQIEGGVIMTMGYALTEDFPLADGKPALKFGQLGLLRATDAPDIETHIVMNAMPADQRFALPAAGAKGVGEIASIPTAAAIQGAYFNRDGVFRTKLPMEDTPYRR